MPTKRYPVTEKMQGELDRRFTYHAPRRDLGQLERYEALRESARFLALEFVVSTPPGREQALALTNLEQAVMWANAAIARGEADEIAGGGSDA